MARELAEGHLVTAGSSKNRDSLGCAVEFFDVDMSVQEVLLDPQTSGGLLLSVSESDSAKMLGELLENGINAAIVAEVVDRRGANIHVY